MWPYRVEADVDDIYFVQELVRVGAPCWVLHPSNGIRPVAEGIAGMAPCTPIEESIGRSLMRELCEEGQQMVTVTKLHKKNTELMYPGENDGSKYLDDLRNHTRLQQHKHNVGHTVLGREGGRALREGGRPHAGKWHLMFTKHERHCGYVGAAE